MGSTGNTGSSGIQGSPGSLGGEGEIGIEGIVFKCLNCSCMQTCFSNVCLKLFLNNAHYIIEDVTIKVYSNYALTLISVIY